MEEETEHRQRIKLWMAGCLICIAILIDLIQFLLTLVAIGAILSPIITVGATFLFWLWYMLLGVSFITNPKRLATFAAESLGELIPVVDVLPLWIIGTIATIMITRSEDKGGLLGKAAGMAAPLMGKKGLAGAGRQFAENPENLRPKFGRYRQDLRLAPNTIGNSKSSVYSHPVREKVTPQITVGITSEPGNVLDLSGTKIASRPRLKTTLESSVASPIISSMEGINPTSNISIEPISNVPTNTSAPELVSLSKFDTTPSPEKDMGAYLENNVYKNLGLSSKDEERAISIETSETGKEILKRSFENNRNSLSTLYKIETIDGRVDEHALLQEKKKHEVEILYPKLEEAFKEIQTKTSEAGIELSLNDLDISAENFDYNQLNKKLDAFGYNFEELVKKKIRSRIENTISSGQNYKNLSPLTTEQEIDFDTKMDWLDKFDQITSDEYIDYSNKLQFNYEDFRHRVLDDIAKTSTSMPVVSRDKYRVKISREELTNEILAEHQNAQKTGFLNSNISPASLKEVLTAGEFKDVFSMTPEERNVIGGGSGFTTRNQTSYLERRESIEKSLGVRKRGDEVVVYGTFATDFNDESRLGGAPQYGDIFIKYKNGTKALYTEGDSMNTLGSELIHKKSQSWQQSDKNAISPDAMLKEMNEGALLRQVAPEHKTIAKTLLSYDLKRMAKMNGDANIGGSNTYIEAQIINPTIEDIESINIPETVLSKARGEEKKFLENLANDPKWHDKIRFT